MIDLKIKKKIKYIFLVTAFILLIIVVGIVIFLRPYQPDQEYLDKAYLNEDVVITNNDNYISIMPKEASSTGAIIYYPGGLVSEEAYIYKASEIADELDQNVFISKFPLDLAVLDINAADRVIDDYPEIEKWTMMGHSLGGSMACRYAAEHRDIIEELVLLASYCDVDISDVDFEVTAIYGRNDAVLSIDSFNSNLPNLPIDTDIAIIPNMNHSKFGNYGEQRGDGNGSISDLEVVIIIVSWIK